ncbi:hypothetical protein E2C01_094397 [Portunus trituberculatus]|uniref:Uncharacterized protein n=1 Tax=Portunus trituberculatus TaxID=210409 RepID=A0A5B7JWR6_PORTR|nr:hypothetical protein [Portunus trituberculatus]
MQNLILWRGMLLLLLLVLVTTSAAVNSEKTFTYNRTQRSEANPAEYEGHLTSERYDDYSMNDATEERLLTGKYEQFIDVTTEILPLTEDYSAFINVTTERIPMTEEHDGYSVNTTPMTGRPSTKKYDKKSIDVTTIRAPLTEEYSEYSVNATIEERLSIAENDTNWMEYDAQGRLPTEEYEWHTVDNITEVFLADDLPCPCPYIGACTSDSLGSTYQIKDVVKSSTVDNITSAIDYVDHYECLVQDGYRRIALETVEELNFVVQCMLCNPKTLFGGK